jgi:hypothetical protein
LFQKLPYRYELRDLLRWSKMIVVRYYVQGVQVGRQRQLSSSFERGMIRVGKVRTH